MALTFFSLTLEEAAEYRSLLYSQIHEIVFYGKGGYDWYTIFDMPLWLRKFTFNKILEHYNSEKDKQQGNSVDQSINAMKTAGFTKDKLTTQKTQQNPVYTTKASKK